MPDEAKRNLHYHELEPDQILAPFVQCYWAVQSDRLTLPFGETGVIPGGHIDLIFNLGDHVYRGDSRSIFLGRARSFVAGPFDRFLPLRATGQFESLGVRFHQGRFPSFSRLRLRDVRNRAVPFAAICQDQILKGEIQAVECRLAQASGTAERIACVESFLAKLLRCSNEPDAIVTAALGLIKDSKGQISVEGLSAALGINGRQLERKFTQHVGLSPKAFCRVTRFRQVKLLLEKNNEPSGCALAYTCGYYDQTHFIREFRVFTGKTPARYAWAQPVGFFLYDHQPTCYL